MHNDEQLAATRYAELWLSELGRVVPEHGPVRWADDVRPGRLPDPAGTINPTPRARPAPDPTRAHRRA